jgi:WD40 repeat protein
MASTLKAVPAVVKSILTPSMTLKGHESWIDSISYFPDGQRMISGSDGRTAQQWDVKAGREIEKARDTCREWVNAVAASRDGRCVITGGNGVELKVQEVKTGNVKKL